LKRAGEAVVDATKNKSARREATGRFQCRSTDQRGIGYRPGGT
jgi:hypothetical protein